MPSEDSDLMKNLAGGGGGGGGVLLQSPFSHCLAHTTKSNQELYWAPIGKNIIVRRML